MPRIGRTSARIRSHSGISAIGTSVPDSTAIIACCAHMSPTPFRVQNVSSETVKTINAFVTKPMSSETVKSAAAPAESGGCRSSTNSPIAMVMMRLMMPSTIENPAAIESWLPQ